MRWIEQWDCALRDVNDYGSTLLLTLCWTKQYLSPYYFSLFKFCFLTYVVPCTPLLFLPSIYSLSAKFSKFPLLIIIPQNVLIIWPRNINCLFLILSKIFLLIAIFLKSSSCSPVPSILFVVFFCRTISLLRYNFTVYSNNTKHYNIASQLSFKSCSLNISMKVPTSIRTFASIRCSSILITKYYGLELHLAMQMLVWRENPKCHALDFYSLSYLKHLTALISFFGQNSKTLAIWPVRRPSKLIFR